MGGGHSFACGCCFMTTVLLVRKCTFPIPYKMLGDASIEFLCFIQGHTIHILDEHLPSILSTSDCIELSSFRADKNTRNILD